MSFKISDVVSPYRIATWSAYPGNWMMNKAETAQKADLLFRNFVKNRLPSAVALIKRLIDTRHVSAVHLPMTINSLFLTYVNEQIELYQTQNEERDLQIDQTWQEFQMALAKKRYELFTQDMKWCSCFFDDLKRLLINADVLAEDFNATIYLWLQIISIADIGDMYLAAIYETKAKSFCISKNKGVVNVELPRGNLEASFYLISHQFSRDYRWVSLRIAQKMQFPENYPLTEAFYVMTGNRFSNVCRVSSLLLDECKEISQSLVFLDLTDNDAIEKISDRLEAMRYSLDQNFSDVTAHIETLQNAIKKGIKATVVSNPYQETADIPEGSHLALLRLMEDYQECHLLEDGYHAFYCIGLREILAALSESNIAIEKYRKEGKCPKLVKDCPSLLPSASRPQYDAKISQELLTSSSFKSERGPKKGKGAVRAQKIVPQPEKKKKAGKEKQEKIQSQATLIPTLTVKLDPLEKLSKKLFNLYQLNDSIPLRQALWHLDALTSIQRSSDIKEAEALILLDATASAAHKLLEQTYRFCLESRGNSFISHNLKKYHLAFDTSPYPDIVKQLYLANHWTRYFYIEKEKWSSLTTQVAHTPPLLDDLVNLAEGKSFAKDHLQNQVLAIIEKTCLQVEKMLLKMNAPAHDVFLAQDIPIQVKNPISLDVFEEIKESLDNFLVKAAFPPHHSVYLYVKQAISALSMLKGSLQKIEASKSPREFATWTSFCVQQIQEAMEDVLHAIEFFKEGDVSVLHELKTLSEKLGLEMGELGNACYGLSFKPRYPAENLSDGLGAQIIDDAETLRQCPECQDGFKLMGPSPKILWKTLDKLVSIPSVMERLMVLIQSSEAFLRTQAVPALHNSYTTLHVVK